MTDPIFNLYYDEIYSSGLDPSARFPVSRYQKLHHRLKQVDHSNSIQWASPDLAKVDDILLVHDEQYVERFLDGQLTEKERRRIGLRPWRDSIVERTLRLTGGALAALHDIFQGQFIAGNMAGGTHHAFRDQGAGYCIFNDLAICAEKALQEKDVNRVLILDLDVHQGDGTAEIFKQDDRVFTVSLHGLNNFPFRKKVSNWDVGFENETGDEEYLESLAKVLGHLRSMNFDLLFYQAGVDGLATDALGLLALSRRGLAKRNQLVMDWCEEMNMPMVVFMGGGYAKPIEDTVDAFTDLFMEAAKRVKKNVTATGSFPKISLDEVKYKGTEPTW